MFCSHVTSLMKYDKCMFIWFPNIFSNVCMCLPYRRCISYFKRYFYVPDTLLYVPKQVIYLLRLMNITTAKHILRYRTKRRLLEPLRLRLTKGFVLSESLLEKLERRLA